MTAAWAVAVAVALACLAWSGAAAPCTDGTCGRPAGGADNEPLATRRRLVVFIAVITAPRNKESRELLRRTWFAADAGRSEGWAARFFVGGDPSWVAGEDDVVVLAGIPDGRGSYNQLWQKVKAAFVWSYEHEPARFYLKADDDVYCHPPSLVNELRVRVAKRAYLGSPRTSTVERAQGGVSVPHGVWKPHTWHEFNQGIHYIMSNDLVAWLAKNKDDLRALGGNGPEDVTMALWMLSLDVHPEDVPWMFYVQAGRWQDGVGAPEPEMESGCQCPLAVVGLDSYKGDFREELEALHGAYARGECACEYVPPHWIRYEAKRQADRGEDCAAAALFSEAWAKCWELQRVCSDALKQQLAMEKKVLERDCR